MNETYLPRHMDSALFKRDSSSTNNDDQLWATGWYISQTVSGMQISQVTALSTTAVYAAIRILSEDVAKIKPFLFKKRADGSREIVTNHWLAKLLRQPNDWMTGWDFRTFLMVQLCLRQNAYFVIIRDRGGRPISFIPVNSDRVAIWEAPDGSLWYRVTPLGLHERAVLAGEPFLIPSEDICHIKGISLNGLMGSSLIVLGKEAIGLNLAYEQQASRWMGSGAKPSGVLQTDQKLTPDAAKRLASDWRDLHTGIQNIGKVAVLERGLKYQAVAFDAAQMDFLNNRRFSIEEIARLLRVPLHMLAFPQMRGSQGTTEQSASEYVNYTLTSYTMAIGEKLDVTFDIPGEGLELGWDYSTLTRADQSARMANYTKGLAGGILTANECRLDNGMDPLEGGDRLWQPTNVAFAGSQAGGGLPDGGGRPEGSPNVNDGGKA